jgi:membrane protein involved in colicin uptake
MAKINTPQIVTMVAIFAVLIGLIIFMRRNDEEEEYSSAEARARGKAEAEAREARARAAKAEAEAKARAVKAAMEKRAADRKRRMRR